ncbi:MAG: BACON domain-containing protein [Paludibacter sp.]|nr:BACON domain-containing protein [Paludibacter sp.]
MRKTLFNWTSCFMLITTMGFFATSCVEKEEVLQPIVEVSSTSLVISRLGLNEEGNTASVNVQSNVYWRVVVIQDDEWLSVFPLAGTGETTLSLTAPLNDGDTRTAKIVLETFDGSKKEIQVTQNSKDETIYYLFEDMGKVATSQVDVNFYDGWTKIGIGSLLTKYTGSNAAMVDNQNPSDGYENASGGNNILFSTDESVIVWGQVGTKEAEYFKLCFGVYAPETFNSNDLRLYISRNGEDWVPLKYTRNNQSGWAKAEAKYKVADVAFVYFKLVANKSNYRTDDIILLEDPDKAGAEVIFQTVIDDDMPVGYEYFKDDFSWITVATFGATPANFPTNELSYTNANITPEQRDTINKYKWSQELGSTYLRVDIMKLGRTRIGGDLISPAFSFIAPFKSINVHVTFDVAMYASATGTEDLDGLLLEVRNGGTINSQALTSYYMDAGLWIRTGQELIEPLKTVTATIYGANSRTQFRIRSGVENSEQTRLNKSNRFFFDNFKVTKAPNE